MSDAFISYSRKNVDFALKLEAALKAADQTVWMDKSELGPGVKWRPEVQLGISCADNFIFIISPDSVLNSLSDFSTLSGKLSPCGSEIEYAVAANKRIIPVLHIYTPSNTLPPAVREVNYIDFRDPAHFDTAFEKLLTALHTDNEWVHAHTRLQTRAQEWEANRFDRSYLLGGADLKAAETWQARPENPGQHVKPTPLQAQYIAASRQVETRSQKIKTRIATAVAVGSLCLAGIALVMFLRARTQARIADAGRLAATAISLKDTQLDLASLLSLEARRMENTFDTRSAQLTLFQSTPNLLSYLHPSNPGDEIFDSAKAIAFRRDGTRFATGSGNGTIELWDSKSRRSLWTHARPGDEVEDLTFSEDGNMLAVAYLNGTLQLWRLSGSQPSLLAGDLKDAPTHPTTVDFDPGGDFLAAGGENGVQVWTLPNLTPRRQLAAKTTVVTTVAFADKDLFAYSTDTTIHFEDTQTAASKGEIALPANDRSDDGAGAKFVITPDGKQLAVDEGHTSLEVFQLSDSGKRETATLRGHLPVGDHGTVMGLAFSRDGSHLAAASSHGAMREWDMTTLQPLRDYPPSLAVVNYTVTYTPDGEQLFSGLKSGTILIWSELETNTQKITLPGLTPYGFTDDGRNLLLAGANHRLARWDIRAAKQTDIDPSSSEAAHSPSQTVAFASPDLGLSAVITSKGVALEDHGTVAAVLPDAPKFPTSVAISIDGRFIAASNTNGTPDSVRLWDVRSGTPKLIPLQGKDNGTFGLAFSPDGKLLATTGHNGLFLWKTVDGSLAGSNIDPGRKPILNAAFSPDGQRIALYLDDGAVLLADTATQNILGLALQDDLHDPTVLTGLAFSPNGQTLAYGGSKGEIFLWDADPKTWQSRPCALANRNLSLTEWKRYIGAAVPYHRTCPNLPDGENVNPNQTVGN